MTPQATALSPQALIDAAKAPFLAYNDKNWDRVRATVTPDFVYDEVAANRQTKGPDEAIELWQSWARAFPDSKGTFTSTAAAGTTAVLEVTWRGTHKGPLLTPNGELAPTGKTIEIRACAVVELAGDKVKMQRHYFDMATLLQQLGVTG